MKKKIHPPYQQILFVDTATNDRFICGSTLQPKEREVHKGKEYPIFRVPISSASHPFFTGSQQLVDAEGRVDRFKKRYARRAPAAPAPSSEGETKEEAKGIKKAVKKSVKKATTKKVAVKKSAPKKTTTKKKKSE